MTRGLGAHLIVASGHRDAVATFSSGLPFLTGNRTAILQHDPHGEIVTIDVEGDVDVLGVQIRAGRITKPLDLAASQDEPTNGVCITRLAFQPIPEMNGAEFVLVSSFQSVLAHCDKRDLIG